LCFLFFLAALQAGAATQKFERDGIVVEFQPSANVIAGQNVDLRFSLRGADGSRLPGLRPAAWIDARDPKAGGSQCREKIQSFLAGSLRARPQVDLNTYYVITLNVEPSVAVIDPLIGFGGSRLLTAVNLQSPGADWVLSPDQKRLFVSMPLVNRVAVIDTEKWEVVENVEAGLKPSRLALAGDSLWVVSDNVVSIIDTKLFETRSVPIGKGPHALAFAGDRGFVTNGTDGTVSVIDSSVSEIKVGPSPVSLAFSELASSIYAADAGGTISVIDPAQRKVTKTIAAAPGLTSIQFAPGGRWGFVTNEKAGAVHVLDSSTASVITTATNVGAKPDQVAFTDEFAYIRAAGSDQVKMIRLAGLGSAAEPAMAVFPAGQLPPSTARVESVAAAIVPAPEPKSVLVANPADRLVYYYSEGMAAPMGNFSVHRRSPKAVLVVDRSLREAEPGVFSIATKVAEEGTYDVAFFLNAPRVVHCFELAVGSNGQPKFAPRTVKIEPLTTQQEFRVGEPFELKFRLADANSGEPHRAAKDVRALAFLAPGTWQKRIPAVHDGEGIYSVGLEVPEEGIYYLFLEAPSLDLKINKTRPHLFEAVANPGDPAHASSSR
jgi:YVTN family beta-propeller protein